MIHTQRRAEGKADCLVFGLSTDNNQFHFLQINDKGEASGSELLGITEVHAYTNLLLVVPTSPELFRPSAGNCRKACLLP